MKAKLTIEEDKYWVQCFTQYLEDHGDTRQNELKADEYAWKECLKRFPRLRDFTGIQP